jgi:ABC-type sugar transport system permease subunit
VALPWIPHPSSDQTPQHIFNVQFLVRSLAHVAKADAQIDAEVAQRWIEGVSQSIAKDFARSDFYVIADQSHPVFKFMRTKRFLAHSDPQRKGSELSKEHTEDKALFDLSNDLQKAPDKLLQISDAKTGMLWVAVAIQHEQRYLAAAITRITLHSGPTKITTQADSNSTQAQALEPSSKPSQEQKIQSSEGIGHTIWNWSSVRKIRALCWSVGLFSANVLQRWLATLAIPWSLLVAIMLVVFAIFRGRWGNIFAILGLAGAALYPYVASVDQSLAQLTTQWEQRAKVIQTSISHIPQLSQQTFSDLLPATQVGEITPLRLDLSTPQKPTIVLERNLIAAMPTDTPKWPFLLWGAIAVLLYYLYASGIIGRFADILISNRQAYLYTAPAMLGMMVLIFIPFMFGVGLSFFKHHGGGEYSFVGLRNFIEILSVPLDKITHPLSFYFTLGVTLLWTSLNVALHVAIGLSLAMLLKNPLLKMKEVYRILLILPWAIPNYITALIWKGMFHKQFGAINSLLVTLGITSGDDRISWFSSFTTAFTANLVTNTWLGFPFMMVVSLGALQSIPKDLYEAADVDGASRWQKFKYITLPLLKPALFPAIILGTIWTFNMFNIIYLVSGGEPAGATDILITESYRWAFERNDQYGYAAAYSVIIFLILLIYSLTTQRMTRATEGIYQEK